MITYQELRLHTKHQLLNINQGLVVMLQAWARPPVETELEALLQNTDCSLKQWRRLLEKLDQQATVGEVEILKYCLANQKKTDEFYQTVSGPLYAITLLEALCNDSQQRIHQAWQQAGLDIAQLKDNVAIAHDKIPDALPKMDECLNSIVNPLLKFGFDLTEAANLGEFDSLSDRPQEMQQLYDILLRQQKPNPVIIGPAGSGKTALIERMALNITQDNVPEALRGVKIYSINIDQIVSGTKYRGSFEENMVKLIQAAEKQYPAILFIDELHKIIGAGVSENITTDAAEILKPALARGKMRIIGATTAEEYQRSIARNLALRRRFQALKLNEPDTYLVLQMLTRQAEKMADVYQLTISPFVIEKTIEFSNAYQSGGHQPDKSVTVLESCCSSVQRQGRLELDVSDILNTIAQQENKPLATLTGDNRTLLRTLENLLKQEIIGQDQAIETVTDWLSDSYMSQQEVQEKPISFLFCGQPGVGKTLLAERICRHLFQTKDRLLQINCSDLNQSSGINTLRGVERGYVDSQQEGVLANFMNRHGAGVILLDEIEKAHQDVMHFLLALLNDGKMQTGRGEWLAVGHCVFVMTSNALQSDDLNKHNIGFINNHQQQDPRGCVKPFFSAEFINRIDEVIIFNSLNERDLKKIILLRLQEIMKQFIQQEQLHIEYQDEALVNYVFKRLQVKKGTARDVFRQVKTSVRLPINRALRRFDKAQNNALTIQLDDDFYRTGKINPVVKTVFT